MPLLFTVQRHLSTHTITFNIKLYGKLIKIKLEKLTSVCVNYTAEIQTFYAT